MIEWNVSPEIFSIGPFSIRWYGVLFAIAFVVGYQIMHWVFKKENKPEDDLNDGIMYMFFGTVIGARLGHCLFYSPAYYLSHPIEIFKIWQGGLASHGAVIGILLAIYFYSKTRKNNQPYLWVLDRLGIVVALGGFFIRIGNLLNSEIIGKAANLPWSFIFVKTDRIPRHPAQLYEAIAYLITFFILLFLYKKKIAKLKQGFLFGCFMVLVFGFRFFVEFFKEAQETFEKSMILNMGQLLSIPCVLIGIYFIFRKVKDKAVL